MSIRDEMLPSQLLVLLRRMCHSATPCPTYSQEVMKRPLCCFSVRLTLSSLLYPSALDKLLYFHDRRSCTIGVQCRKKDRAVVTQQNHAQKKIKTTCPMRVLLPNLHIPKESSQHPTTVEPVSCNARDKTTALEPMALHTKQCTASSSSERSPCGGATVCQTQRKLQSAATKPCTVASLRLEDEANVSCLSYASRLVRLLIS